MKYELHRPSGHCVKRGECADLFELNSILDSFLNSLGGYLEAFVDDDFDCPALAGGGYSSRIFVQQYDMVCGNRIPAGSIAHVLSVSGPDVHVDVYAKDISRCQRWTFSQRDFMNATKP